MRITRSRLVAVLLTGLLAAGAAACGSDDDAVEHRPGRTRSSGHRRQRSTRSVGRSGAALDVNLRLGYFPNVTHAPAIIGVDTGLFAAFARSAPPRSRP